MKQLLITIESPFILFFFPLSSQVLPTWGKWEVIGEKSGFFIFENP